MADYHKFDINNIIYRNSSGWKLENGAIRFIALQKKLSVIVRIVSTFVIMLTY